MITAEKLNEALELISKGVTRPTKIAAAMGMAYRTYCDWMVRSNSGDERFLVTFNGETMQWARAITLATKLALFELRGMILQEGIFGYDEVQTKDGQIVWAIDPVAAALSEEDREWMGYRKDALLEINGALQPVTIKRKSPFAQQIRLLEAAFPDLRPSQTITQNVNLAQVGVGFAKPVDYSKGPPPVPPPPPMPALEAPITDGEFSEVADPELEEMLGPEPQPAAPININIGVTLAEPEIDRSYSDAPTAAETPPKQEGIQSSPRAYDAAPSRPPRSPLEESLYQALEEARARARKAQS
jgi:hypothetical protein